MSVHDDLAAQFRRLCPFRHDEDYSSCDYCTERVSTMMVMANSHFYTLTGKSFDDFELWTCEKAARYMGLASGAVARARLSKLNVKAHGYRPHPVSGRAQALYVADEVRANVTKKDPQCPSPTSPATPLSPSATA